MAEVDKPVRTPGARPDRVRLIVLVYRKQGLSEEDFRRAWREDFAPMFAALPIVKKNIYTYEQAHINAEAVARFRQTGIPIEEADGIAIYEAMTYEKLFETFKDEEFLKAVEPEEDKLLDKSRSIVFPVDIVSVFDDPT